MFIKTQTTESTGNCSEEIEKLKRALENADAVVIGAGAGLSASAGHTYSGERFQKNFPDFIEKYRLRDMYTAGFYPFPTAEESWAYWSRHILLNRYTAGEKEAEVFGALLHLVQGRDYFVLTTNADHCFQRAGFDKERLFYTQGDYGLFQCSAPCCQKTYDNEAPVRRMAAEQKEMRIPSELVPMCPVCGEPMAMNLRKDDRFVEDAGWHAHAALYESFLERHRHVRVLYLELGVGYNTPGIIKLPFWQMTCRNPLAEYVCINAEEETVPQEIAARSVILQGDIGTVLKRIEPKSMDGGK